MYWEKYEKPLTRYFTKNCDAMTPDLDLKLIFLTEIFAIFHILDTLLVVNRQCVNQTSSIGDIIFKDIPTTQLECKLLMEPTSNLMISNS